MKDYEMKNYESGFTMIELLVTVAIIGILAATATAEFGAYKKRAYQSAAISDLRHAVTSQEAYYSDNEEYANCIGTNDCKNTLPGFMNSSSVGIQSTANILRGSFLLQTCNILGSTRPSSPKVFSFQGGGDSQATNNGKIIDFFPLAPGGQCSSLID